MTSIHRLLSLSLAVISFITLSGCNKPSDSYQSDASFEVLADRVVLDSDLVLTSNPEQYQPSFNLRGKLLPIEQATLEAPFTGHHVEFLVQKGDWVEKDQVLARMQSEANKTMPPHEHIEIISEGKKTPIVQNSAVPSIPDNIMSSIEMTEKPSSIQSTSKHPALSNQSKTEAEVISNTTTEESTVIDYVETFDNPDTTYKGVNKAASPKASPTVSEEHSDSNSHDTHSSATKATNRTELQPQQVSEPMSIVFRAPIEGEVVALTKNDAQTIAAKQTLIEIADTRQLQLVGNLPLNTQSKLSVGQPVNFNILDAHLNFTGQISHVIPKPKFGYLTVKAPVIPSEENKAILEYGMPAIMIIEYGQMQLGVRLPKQSIQEADLTDLSAKYTRPVSPIHGFVWVIQQNERLAYTPVEVVEYFPQTDRFLVHGINNDSLICTADLPKSADGKRVVIR